MQQRTTQYLHPTPTGYKLVTRTIGNRTKRTTKKRKIGLVERFFAPWLLVFTASICYGMMIGKDMQVQEMQVQAKVDYFENSKEMALDTEARQTEPTPTPEPKTQKEQIIAYIHEVFGDDGELMVKIFTCESGLVPDKIGDKHLMGMLDGEMIGDSVGVAQIRTGDAGVYDSKPWNRAKANSMSVAEFREQLKDWKYNIDYAKTIYDRQGVSAWWNCSQKVK